MNNNDMDLATARSFADKVLHATNDRAPMNTDKAFRAYNILDAVILTPLEEKADFARKAAVARHAFRP